jgi:PiT family inorganic phosphate transporter
MGVKGLYLSGIAKIASFIVLSPLIGMFLGSSMMIVTAWIVRRQRPARVDTWFRKLQLVSSGVFSYSHGSNDAQKVMGIISVVLYGTIWSDRQFHVPWWVVLLTHGAIALGTFLGGWRIVKTMGYSLTKLQPIGGFCAETGGGVTILALSHWGIPVSTTHTITGAIVGVGSTKGFRAVRWGVAGRILWAWVFTIPMSALVAWFVFVVTHFVVDLLR